MSDESNCCLGFGADFFGGVGGFASGLKGVESLAQLDAEDIIINLVRPVSGIALPFLIRMMACLMARS